MTVAAKCLGGGQGMGQFQISITPDSPASTNEWCSINIYKRIYGPSLSRIAIRKPGMWEVPITREIGFWPLLLYNIHFMV
jgi:hypothetical protein